MLQEKKSESGRLSLSVNVWVTFAPHIWEHTHLCTKSPQVKISEAIRQWPNGISIISFKQIIDKCSAWLKLQHEPFPPLTGQTGDRRPSELLSELICDEILATQLTMFDLMNLNHKADWFRGATQHSDQIQNCNCSLFWLSSLVHWLLWFSADFGCWWDSGWSWWHTVYPFIYGTCADAANTLLLFCAHLKCLGLYKPTCSCCRLLSSFQNSRWVIKHL